MNETMNWDDLRFFALIARSGGLAAASKPAGASPPTLGRRMARLESTIGRQLFIRQRDGYILTEAGDELLALTDNVEIAAAAIDRWRMQTDAAPTVKIAAGPWTAVFLAANFRQLQRDPGPSIEILSNVAPVDLVRREAQIGIRNRRPEARGLACQKLMPVQFAVYGKAGLPVASGIPASSTDLEHATWLELAGSQTSTPSSLWLQNRLGGRTPVRLPTTHTLLEAAVAGAGYCVLPCFVGDRHPALARKSDLIRELAHDQWLVSHDEDRHTQPVRTIIDRLAALLRQQRALFAGEAKRPIT